MDNLTHISESLGLHPKSLYALRARRDDFPDPVYRAGGGFALYDAPTVIAWYDASVQGNSKSISTIEGDNDE